MSANKLLAADAVAFCAKQRDIRSETLNRQVTPGERKGKRHFLFFATQLISRFRDKPFQQPFKPDHDILAPSHPNQSKAQQVDADISTICLGQTSQMKAFIVHEQMQSAGGRIQDGERV
jgi:hypothetical protein